MGMIIIGKSRMSQIINVGRREFLIKDWHPHDAHFGLKIPRIQKIIEIILNIFKELKIFQKKSKMLEVQ